MDSAQGKAAEDAVTDADPARLAALVWAGASFPVENFQAYTSPFGYRASATGGYGQEFHYGLDIASPVGSYIRSWWTGTVVEISDGSNCGTSIVIESGAWTHIYCHMSGYAQVHSGKTHLVDREAGLSLVEGQTVAAGDPIGRVGMTGRTTGPHLHWGLKYEGSWVDPAWVVRAMAASQQALYGQQ
ncbi:MAG: M23 family metallopeptidase [Cyanobacteria bacterium P01_A01_bin.135]